MKISEFDLGWAVGLFEGEGCFTMNISGPNREFKYPVAMMSNADDDVMHRFHQIVGIGTLTYQKQRVNRPNDKRLWHWQAANRQDFKAFSELVKPYLSYRRMVKLLEVEANASPIKRRDFYKRNTKRKVG